MACQSWKSKKIALRSLFYLVKRGSNGSGVDFFGPPNLIGHSFAAPWPMMMHSNSFESPKPYLFGYCLKNSIIALLRYVICAQSTPISLHTEGFVPFVSLSTVQRLISIIRNMFSYIGISSCVIVPHTVVAYIFTPTPQSFPFPSPCCQSCPDTSKAVIKQ